jgi:4-amino-4-deoxy-L-arabinose transferase-like glycosyltransferase
MENDNHPKLFAKPWLTTALIVVLFVAALGIRLYDLTDLPNDFYMVRQYRSLLISRGMYYEHLTTVPEWQRNLAEAQWKGEGLIEPPIMEVLTALTYDFTGVQIWIGRIYASLFWLSGGLAIWLLAREMSMRGGGIIALAYFLFVPLAVTVSRAFLPDPLMVAAIAWALWALYRWEIRRTWKSTLLAGILMGITIFVKSVAVFPLLGAAIGLVLSRGSLKRILADKQTWAVVGITAIPTIIYYIYGFTSNDLGSQFSLRFFPEMLKDPSFYVRWLFLAAGFSGFVAMFASLTGILLFPSNGPRFMAIGMWIGYIAYGLAFPYHFMTHDYYHLPLIVIVTFGLIPVADLLVRQVMQKTGRLWQAAFIGLLLFGISMQMWLARNSVASANYRDEAAFWQELGQTIGHDKNIVELSGDYGYRLAYWGWVGGSQWMTTGDVQLRQLAGQIPAGFSSMFAEQTAGKDLFLITNPSEWQSQADLRDYLTTHYKLIAMDEGDGYWIFDLHQPISP